MHMSSDSIDLVSAGGWNETLLYRSSKRYMEAFCDRNVNRCPPHRSLIRIRRNIVHQSLVTRSTRTYMEIVSIPSHSVCQRCSISFQRRVHDVPGAFRIGAVEMHHASSSLDAAHTDSAANAVTIRLERVCRVPGVPKNTYMCTRELPAAGVIAKHTHHTISLTCTQNGHASRTRRKNFRIFRYVGTFIPHVHIHIYE